MNRDDILCKLRGTLDERRFNHCLGVEQAGVRLAEHYGADVKKASTAGLLHDCAKHMSMAQLLNFAEANGIDVDDETRASPKTLHAPVGAYIAQTGYLVTDSDVLAAIRSHTTGCGGMSLLQKIIYLADLIEPGRDMPMLDELRKLAYIDIDAAVFVTLCVCLRHVVAKGYYLHRNSINAYNELALSLKESNIKDILHRYWREEFEF